MATAETVLAVYSDPRLCQENKALESWMRSKDSCPVWGEGIGKAPPIEGGNSPVSYSTARPRRAPYGPRTPFELPEQRAIALLDPYHTRRMRREPIRSGGLRWRVFSAMPSSTMGSRPGPERASSVYREGPSS